MLKRSSVVAAEELRSRSLASRMPSTSSRSSPITGKRECPDSMICGRILVEAILDVDDHHLRARDHDVAHLGLGDLRARPRQHALRPRRRDRPRCTAMKVGFRLGPGASDGAAARDAAQSSPGHLEPLVVHSGFVVHQSGRQFCAAVLAYGFGDPRPGEDPLSFASISAASRPPSWS